jgi:urate oxidase
MVMLAENRYGKCRVRVVRVRRDRSMHRFEEWTVEVLLQGDFHDCFVTGDNSKILATDTMKNTIYSLARDTGAESIEDFALELGEFFIRNNPQLDTARVKIDDAPWRHISVDGEPYPTAFIRSGGELKTTVITRAKDGTRLVSSGLDDLVIMKTANSSFVGFLRDSYTTLAETADRLFGTAVRAEWKYSAATLPFAALRERIRATLLKTFAEHDSKSVQHTLYAMGKAVLEAVEEIDDIELVMPNRHCLLVDLSKFGKTNPNEIFVPTEEPYGYIEARIRR